MKIAYFDCFWGMSGDMFLASLIDAGLEFSLFKKELKKTGLPQFSIYRKRIKRNEISATQIIIEPDKRKRFSYLEFREIIKKLKLSPKIKKKVLFSFDDLADAERKIHGTNTKDFSFEQLGEIDTLVDIVGAYLAIELLGIEKIYFSRIRLGRGGFFKHGDKFLPLPAPAVLELLKNIPIEFVEEPYEFVTPTGAVLIKNLFFGDTSKLPRFRINSIGYGIGTISFGKEINFLRVILGETE